MLKRRHPVRCPLWKVLGLLFVFSLLNAALLVIRDTVLSLELDELNATETSSSAGTSSPVTSSSLSSSSLVDNRTQPERIIKILYWNRYFRSLDFKFGLGRDPFLQNGCRVTQCATTRDSSELSRSDVVMFHGPQIPTLPPIRRPDQLYVYVQREPWMDMSEELMPAYSASMNLTMTYRLDSDIPVPYAEIHREPGAAETATAVDPRARPKSVVWVVSHCETLSRREKYVAELRKHIDVDIYGSCGNLQCNKTHNNACWEHFARTYRFVLAFENDVCQDYVSEKVYRPLNYGLVPVVLGGAPYDRLTPPHSVINVRDFSGPRALAKRLHHLGRNQHAYSEYFRWRSDGFRVENYRRTLIGRGFCRLCEILHDPDYQYRRYPDLRGWWTDGTCDRQAVDRLMGEGT